MTLRVSHLILYTIALLVSIAAVQAHAVTVTDNLYGTPIPGGAVTQTKIISVLANEAEPPLMPAIQVKWFAGATSVLSISMKYVIYAESSFTYQDKAGVVKTITNKSSLTYTQQVTPPTQVGLNFEIKLASLTVPSSAVMSVVWGFGQ